MTVGRNLKNDLTDDYLGVWQLLEPRFSGVTEWRWSLAFSEAYAQASGSAGVDARRNRGARTSAWLELTPAERVRRVEVILRAALADLADAYWRQGRRTVRMPWAAVRWPTL